MPHSLAGRALRLPNPNYFFLFTGFLLHFVHRDVLPLSRCEGDKAPAINKNGGNTMLKKKFELGRLVATPGVLDAVSQRDITKALERHMTGDWGECCTEDAESNEQAIHNGARIFSVYRDQNDERFWIITEATDDRGVRRSTCVLLPSEY